MRLQWHREQSTVRPNVCQQNIFQMKMRNFTGSWDLRWNNVSVVTRISDQFWAREFLTWWSDLMNCKNDLLKESLFYLSSGLLLILTYSSKGRLWENVRKNLTEAKLQQLNAQLKTIYRNKHAFMIVVSQCWDSGTRQPDSKVRPRILLPPTALMQ